MIHKLFKVQLENFIANSMIVHIELLPIEGREGLDQTSWIKFKIALLIQGVLLFFALAKENCYCYCSSNLCYSFI